MATKTCLVFFGPQGGGKGTQSCLLAKELGIPQISAGDLLREEARQGTERGKIIKELIDNGKYAPEEMTNEIIADRVAREDCLNGYILDGYPRSAFQAEFFEKNICRDYRVILISISEKETIRRLAERLNCSCGRTYHPEFNPPKKEGACDVCGQKLVVREDDKKPEFIRQRLEIYRKVAEPLVELFREKGVLIEINGEQPIEKIHEDILKAIDK